MCRKRGGCCRRSSRRKRAKVTEGMKPLPIQDVRRAIGGRSTTPLPREGPVLSAVCTDTRAMKADSLFVALKGENFDGHQFLDVAAAGGAIAAVVSDVPESPPKHLRLLVVADTRVAFGKLAKQVRSTLRAKVVAVAGSNGKTSTKYLIDAVLGAKLKGSMSPKSFNNDIGVPLTIFAAEENHDYLVLELGTNHIGEISNLTKIAQPDIAVITNCTAEHLEFLGSLAGVRFENSSIIEGLNPKGSLIVNGDDPALLSAVAKFHGQKITIGFKETNDLFAADVVCDATGVRFKLNGRLAVFVPMLGKHTAANALAAIAVGKRFRMTDEEIISGLANAHGPEMRLQLDDLNGVSLLNDAYNANPASVKAALETLKTLPTRGRRIAIIGDMRELGPTAEKLHEEVGEFAATCSLHLLVCVGELSRHVAEAAIKGGMTEDRVKRFPDAEATAKEIVDQIADGDVVLLKASRGIHLEIVAKALRDKRM
jgi:UDP-N-acetylmuramoyl-tripeptide--D-alanyl-D-alanine ligase